MLLDLSVSVNGCVRAYYAVRARAFVGSELDLGICAVWILLLLPVVVFASLD